LDKDRQNRFVVEEYVWGSLFARRMDKKLPVSKESFMEHVNEKKFQQLATSFLPFFLTFTTVVYHLQGQTG